MKLNKRSLFAIILSTFLFLSCSKNSFKIIEERGEMADETVDTIASDGDFLNMLIYFENSMSGEKVHISTKEKIYFDGYIKSPSTVGIAQWFSVPNDGEIIDLKINDQQFYIPFNRFSNFQFLIISKVKKSKDRKVIYLTYTNNPKAYL